MGGEQGSTARASRPGEDLGCQAKQLGLDIVGDSQPLEGLEQSSK